MTIERPRAEIAGVVDFTTPQIVAIAGGWQREHRNERRRNLESAARWSGYRSKLGFHAIGDRRRNQRELGACALIDLGSKPRRGDDQLDRLTYLQHFDCMQGAFSGRGKPISDRCGISGANQMKSVIIGMQH